MAGARADDRVENVYKIATNLNILQFHSHIWNHYEKCIQISPNMPGIGSVIPEIAFEI